MRREEFKKFLKFLAAESDVDILPHKVVTGSRAIRLCSENRSEIPEGFSFTTTKSLIEMFDEWCAEMKSRDGDSGSFGVKLKSIFRSSIVRESLKTYESGDSILRVEPALGPSSNLAWMPPPSKKIDVDERDLFFLEKNARATCRALNFAEIMLQAWKPGETELDVACRIRRCMSKAVKAMMQVQVASTCGLVQLRRDHYLAGVRGLSVEEVQSLRHAPWLGDEKLFPSELLKELSESNFKSLQTRALLRAQRTDGATSNGKAGRFSQSTSFYNNYYAQQRRGWPNNYSRCDSHIPILKRAVAKCVRPVQPSSSPTSLVRSESPDGVESPGGVESPLPSGFPEGSENYDWERAQILEQKKIPVGGRLRFFWKEWRAIGASKKIARWLNRGYRLPFGPDLESQARASLTATCPPSLVPSYPATSLKGGALRDMMMTLLEKDVIEVVPAGALSFFNVVFLRPKPNGKWRLILDVSRLNKFLVVQSFSMDTVHVIRNAIEADTWATSIDLSDAYHHVPVHENYRCFLAFQVGDVAYRYKACPFGLSPLPQVFTLISEVVKVYARREWQLSVFQYIDDWLFVSADRARVAWATRCFVRLCIRLGLIVNLDKSVLVASRSLVHLGVLWDFKAGRVRPTDERIESIRATAMRAAQVIRFPLPLLESLMGKLVSVERTVPWGRLHYRSFQTALLRELSYGRSFRWVHLCAAARDDLKWWSIRSHLLTWMSFRTPNPSRVIFTDASHTGWGAACEQSCIRGLWSFQEKSLHINVLEMRAVLKTLQLKSRELTGRVVLFRIDNLSTVYYINKQGGTRSPFLAREAMRVLRFACDHNITLLASHIKGELNVLADMLSRSTKVLKTEWRLSRATFEWIVSQSCWGPPTIDLFANRLNFQLPRYFSPCLDPAAMGTDALLCPWPDEVCYAFPPTTILSRVAEKILMESPRRLILVAPYWPTKSWFPALAARATRVLDIPLSVLSLRQPHFPHQMAQPESLCLAVWLISFPGSET